MSKCEELTHFFVLPALNNHVRMFSVSPGCARIIPPAQKEILSPNADIRLDLTLEYREYKVNPKLQMPRWINFYINPYPNIPICTDWIKLPLIRFGIKLDKVATVYAKIC